MKQSSFIAALSVASLLSSNVIAAPAAISAPSVNAPPEHFPIYVSQDRALVMLRLGAHSPVPVVFDTGASGTAIDLTLAQGLGLPDDGPSDSTDGQGSPIPGHKTRLTDASISGVKVPRDIAFATAYNLPDEVGIFSPNSFSGRLIKIEISKNRVTLMGRTDANTPRCRSYAYSHDFAFGGNHDDTLPTAELNVNGKLIPVEIDTGNNSGLVLPASYITDLPLQARPRGAGMAQSQVSQESAYEGRLSVDASVSGVVLSRPEILFAQKLKPALGLQVLRKFIIVLDPVGQRDWLIPDGYDAATCGPKPVMRVP